MRASRMFEWLWYAMRKASADGMRWLSRRVLWSRMPREVELAMLADESAWHMIPAS